MTDSSRSQRFYIHAGAHRTGSSSFQQGLNENRQHLANAGFISAYPSRDGVAGGELALRLPSLRHRAGHRAGFVAKARENLTEARLGQAGDLIISDENLIGPMVHFNQGRFYPACRKRLEVLAEAMQGPVAHLMIVVRAYGALFVSAHRKRAEERLVGPFDSYMAHYAQMDRGRPEIVTLLRDVLRPARLSVVPYAARGSNCAMLGHLTGLCTRGLVEPDVILNQSATDRALVALQGRYQSGDTLRREARARVIKRYANQRKDRGFAHLGAEVADLLAQRYADDLERIAVMSGVELCRLSDAPPALPHPTAHPSLPDHFQPGFFPAPSDGSQPLQSGG